MSALPGLSGPTLAEALGRPANGFTPLRLALALFVVVSHAFSVTTGRVEGEPLYGLTGFTLGEHAVNGFFALSGFLVTMSLDRRGPRDYALARALRIVPGFLAATLVVTFGLGTALTTLPAGEYLRQGATWSFAVQTLTAFKTNLALPGLFEGNPLRLPMGTVWTLKYETICYLGLLAAGLAGLIRRRGWALALLGALALGIVLRELLSPGRHDAVETSLRLVFLFGAGACLYLWRDRVRVSGILAAGLVLAAVAFHATPAYRAALFAAEAYGVVALALSPALARPAATLRHDLSYGVYLYGWPIQQSLVGLAPGLSALALLAPSIGLALGVAALSWFAVERPALRLKERALGRRTLGPSLPAAP